MDFYVIKLGFIWNYSEAVKKIEGVGLWMVSRDLMAREYLKRSNYIATRLKLLDFSLTCQN